MNQQHPAGWYGQSDGTQRYWDGAQWSNQVAADPSAPAAAPKKPWYKRKRIIIPAIAVLAVLIFPKGGGDETDVADPVASATISATTSDPSVEVALEDDEPPVTPAESTDPVAPEEAETTAPAVVETTPAPAPETADPGPDMTVSQSQAVSKAEQYLQFSAFSKSGLADQLEFEGFSPEDATFAVEHIDVDWMEQAKLKAANYLEFSAFSLTGLVDQLEFEGFTTEEAQFGVNNIEVDWMEQAALKAQSYLDYSAFSRAGLIDQLEFEGFTPEQAAHGADSVGL